MNPEGSGRPYAGRPASSSIRRVREIRSEASETVAARAGVSTARFALIESGHTLPTAAELGEIAAALEVEVGLLFESSASSMSRERR